MKSLLIRSLLTSASAAIFVAMGTVPVSVFAQETEETGARTGGDLVGYDEVHSR